MNQTANLQLGPIMTSIAGTELTAIEKERLLSPPIGGLVLFARNCESVEQLRALTDEVHHLRNPSLLIAIDQEGGRVQRLKSGVTELPPQAAYGRIYDDNPDRGCDAAELGGYLMAREVLDSGIDLSFSPVLDVASAASEVIGDRAFHSDANTVSILAESWIRGMQKAGMKAVGKHFPGHGGVIEDSHTESPEDHRNIKDILNCDLVPYRRLGERLSAVMTAHVLFPEITSAIPTYSAFWLDHMLREVLAFYGPVFSDDLSMAAASEAGDIETRVHASLSSGCDIALICQSEAETDGAIDGLNQLGSWKDPSWHIENLRPETQQADDSTDRLKDQFADFLNFQT